MECACDADELTMDPDEFVSGREHWRILTRCETSIAVWLVTATGAHNGLSGSLDRVFGSEVDQPYLQLPANVLRDMM